MRKIVVSIVLIFISLPAIAQVVTNLYAQQEGRDIVVRYDLSDKADVSLDVRFNGRRQKISMLSGDIGKSIESGNQKKIVWHVLDEKGSTFLQKNVVFTVRANAPYRTILLAEGGISALPFTPSGGLMIGGVKRVGWYVKGRSNFIFRKTQPSGTIIPDGNAMILNTYNGDKIIPNDAMLYNITGEYYTTHWIANAGMIVRCWHQNPMDIYVYFGAGYGERKQVWQTIHDGYLTYIPSYHSNVSGDLGILFSYKKFMLSAGVTSIGYKYIDMQLGLGVVL
jgi:hypothetical protein